jgi:hypothetical protein
MTNQLPTTELFSYNQTDWPQEPMALWRKLGVGLAIAMMLALVALASIASSSPGPTSTLIEHGGPYP